MRLLVTIGIVLFSSALKAQGTVSLRDSINSLFDVMRTEADSTKLMAAATLETLLESFYADAENFTSEFDSVPFLGQLSSPDGAIGMACWNLAFEDGSFQYHAVMRHRSDKNTVVVTTFEDTEDWDRMERKPFRPSSWYGALYYRILSNKHRGKTYYTILGWDGKDNITNRKVVDVITLQGRLILLGASIFKDEKNRPANRLVFEYANDVSMSLNYDDKEDLIIMDHLAPEDSRFVGQYQFYGPDFSYDALQCKKGEWLLLKDVFAKNRSLNNLPENTRPGEFND